MVYHLGICPLLKGLNCFCFINLDFCAGFRGQSVPADLRDVLRTRREGQIGRAREQSDEHSSFLREIQSTGMLSRAVASEIRLPHISKGDIRPPPLFSCLIYCIYHRISGRSGNSTLLCWCVWTVFLSIEVFRSLDEDDHSCFFCRSVLFIWTTSDGLNL